MDWHTRQALWETLLFSDALRANVRSIDFFSYAYLLHAAGIQQALAQHTRVVPPLENIYRYGLRRLLQYSSCTALRYTTTAVQPLHYLSHCMQARQREDTDGTSEREREKKQTGKQLTSEQVRECARDTAVCYTSPACPRGIVNAFITSRIISIIPSVTSQTGVQISGFILVVKTGLQNYYIGFKVNAEGKEGKEGATFLSCC